MKTIATTVIVAILLLFLVLYLALLLLPFYIICFVLTILNLFRMAFLTILPEKSPKPRLMLLK